MPRLSPAREPLLRSSVFPISMLSLCPLQPALPFHLQISTPLSLNRCLSQMPQPKDQAKFLRLLHNFIIPPTSHLSHLSQLQFFICLLKVFCSTKLSALGRQSWATPSYPHLLAQDIVPVGVWRHIGAWMGECTDGWLDILMDGWMYWWLGGCTDGWVNEWMTDFSDIQFINISHSFIDFPLLDISCKRNYTIGGPLWLAFTLSIMFPSAIVALSVLDSSLFPNSILLCA